MTPSSRPTALLTAAAAATLLLAAPGCESVQQYNPFESKGTRVDEKSDAAELAESGDALPAYAGVKQAIGVVDFDNRSGWAGWRTYQMDRNFPLMFESALFDTGRFVLVERENLGEVVIEQDLQTSGRMAEASNVAQTGKLRPARYLATGEVVGVEDNQSGQEGGFGFRGVRLGGGQANAQIDLIVKLIDTTTGAIVAKESITGKAGSSKLRVGLSRRGFRGDVGSFAKTPMSEAVQDALDQAARFLAEEMEELPNTGQVVSAINGQVVINRGSEHNLKAGSTFTLVEAGEEIVDPGTGEVLGTTRGAELGQLRVARVDEKMSYCDVVGGGEAPATGTIVRLR